MGKFMELSEAIVMTRRAMEKMQRAHHDLSVAMMQLRKVQSESLSEAFWQTLEETNKFPLPELKQYPRQTSRKKMLDSRKHIL